MPTAPRARCSEIYCPNWAEHRGKCADHYVPWERPSKRNTMYTKNDLAQWAKAVLERDRTCRGCGSAPAVEADHIIPVSQGGAGLSMDNGQGLCTPCHKGKTIREAQQRAKKRGNRRKDVW